MNVDRLLARFRISAAMGPYALRIRLRGKDFDFGSDPKAARAFNECIGEMRRILLKKRIPAVAADRAILKTLEAAVDFQPADLRHRALKTMEAHSYHTLDRLIMSLRQLSQAIAQLPTTSKGELNKRVLAKIGQTPFDCEVFIEIIETLAATLADIGPRRWADNILYLIHPGPGRRSPIIDQWEGMPAATRVKVEVMVQAIPSRSLVRWLDDVAELLDRERPAQKRGAPRSTARAFVSRVAAIWRTLGLKPGLAYNFLLHPSGGRVASSFQRYCRAVLTAVGDGRPISARQVVNSKKASNNK
jgi:hypothetical protein